MFGYDCTKSTLKTKWCSGLDPKRGLNPCFLRYSNSSIVDPFQSVGLGSHIFMFHFFGAG